MFKIAVLGSCVSRDSFNSKFISDYKKYYSCAVHQNQTSMVSLTGKPIPFQKELINNLKPFDTRHFESELDKRFFSEMKKHKPDYLIIDFYADLYYGFQKIGNSYITNKKWKWKKTDQYSKLDKKEEYSIFNDEKEQYMKLWKKGVHKLFAFLKKELPNCKVIINQARFLDHYLEKETGTVKKLSESGLKRRINVSVFNQQWDELDNYVIKNYHARALQYDMKKYYLDEDHPWGIFYVHYNKEFYHDFTRQLLGIILKDTLKEKNDFITKSKRNFWENSYMNIKNLFLNNSFSNIKK